MAGEKPKSYNPQKNTNIKRFVPKDKIKKLDLYNSMDWRNYRFRYIHHNPKCYACPNDSSVVDHVYPHKGDVQLFEKNDNHIPLCKPCHDTITGLYDNQVTPNTIEKLKWLKDSREKYQIKVRVKVIPYRK